MGQTVRDPQDSTIHDVSDTALWVAHYRAQETEREDSLFKDPFAKKLVGQRGEKIAKNMGSTSKYISWTLAIRTCIIDELIENLISEGIDTIVNLGAGLDTRPYRMNLKSSITWVEVDYPHMIDYKESLLSDEKPTCNLKRIRLDLSNRKERQNLFKEIAGQSSNILAITEGVIPYLTQEQVGELADDLCAIGSFRYWITEYFSSEVYKYIRTPRRMKQLKNAPFLFFPDDWLGFFKTHGWSAREIKYLGEESLRLNRPMPAPWWVVFLKFFISDEKIKKANRFTGYCVFARTN
ncbi:MAG: class I SAM-dependent methyltransferase [Bacteriovoracia bacterium]